MSETKPGLPTTPGTYRLQYKGGHEIILRFDGHFWSFLSGPECDKPRDVVCHAPIEPLVLPEEPKPVSLVGLCIRESMNSDHYESTRDLFASLAVAIESLTKERDEARAVFASMVAAAKTCNVVELLQLIEKGGT